MADLDPRVDDRQLHSGAVLASVDSRGHPQIGASGAAVIRERHLPGVAQVPLLGKQRVATPGRGHSIRRFAPHGDPAVGIGRETVQEHVRVLGAEPG